MPIKQNDQQNITEAHCPVLLQEMLNYLAPENGKNYLDCTFGAGGYSAAILGAANCSVTALDQDYAVKKYADKLLLSFPANFTFLHTNFSHYAEHEKTKKYDGVILDLGVSSMQLDQSERGFSFMHDGPLDMRMSSQGNSATDLLENIGEEELANIIYQYGDEKFSRKIAKNICQQRQNKPITTTLQLAEIIHQTIGNRKGKIDSATKTFQALRIYINNELENLHNFLENVSNLMNNNSKLLIVSFHSLEDRIVKYFFKNNAAAPVAKSKYAPAAAIEDDKWLRIMNKKPVVPSKAEILANSRSRSAKLRVASKIQGILC